MHATAAAAAGTVVAAAASAAVAWGLSWLHNAGSDALELTSQWQLFFYLPHLQHSALSYDA